MPPPLDDELERYRKALRRLARKLVYDEDRAEDLVQDTLVVWLAKRPPGIVNLEEWLKGALVNLFREERRRNARRRERELRAARGDSVPDESDSVAKLELGNAIFACIREMEEPYLTTITLYAVDRLSAHQIADRMNVSPYTVRTRLSRGIGVLREELRRRGLAPDGDRGLAGLIALAGSPPWRLLLRLLPGSVRIASALAAITAVGVLAYATLPFRGGSPLDGLDSGRGPDIAGRGSPESGSRPFSPTADGRTEALQSERWIVRGSVSWPLGQTSREVLVHARVLDAPPPLGAELAHATGTSSEQGSFQISLPAPTVHAWLELSATSSTDAIWSDPTLAYVPNGHEPPDGLVVEVLPADARLIVRARTVDGRPVADGSVRARASDGIRWRSPDAVPFSAGGTLQLDVPSARSGIDLIAGSASSGFVERSVGGLEPGEQREVLLVFGPPVTVGGTVRGPDGALLSGARLTPIDPPVDPVTTGADGAFVLSLVEEDSNALVLVEAPGLAPWIAELEPAAENDVRLRHGITLCGSVGNALGEGVAGAWVRASWLGIPWMAVTDEQGEFVLDPLPAARLEIELVGPGSGAVTLSLDLRTVLGEHHETFVLAGERAVGGSVTDMVGRPLPGAIVEVPGFPGLGRLGTDLEGRFRVPHVPVQIDALAVSLGGMGRSRVPLPASGGDVLVVLQEGSELRGEVVDAVTGHPIEDFRLRISTGEGTTTAERLEVWSRQGRLRLPSTQPPGTPASLGVSSPGYAPRLVETVTASTGAAETLLIELEPERSLDVLVVTNDGSPIQRANVTVVGANVRARQVLDRFTEQTGIDGVASFTNLPTGRIRLSVKHREFASLDHEVEVSSDLAVLQLVLERGTTLQGHLRDPAGAPIPGQAIVADFVSDGSPLRLSTVTDAEGAFTLKHLPSTEVRLAWNRTQPAPDPKAPGYVHPTRNPRELEALDLVRVVSISGDALAVDLVPRGSSTLGGWVVAEVPLPERMVARLVWLGPALAGDPDSESVQRAAAVEDGQFRFEGLENGNYRLEIVGHTPEGGRLRGEQTVTIMAGTSLEVPVSLALDPD